MNETYTMHWSDLYVKFLSPVHGYGDKIKKKRRLNDYPGNVGQKICC